MLSLETHWQHLLKDTLPDLAYYVQSLSEEHCLMTLQLSYASFCVAGAEVSKRSAHTACRPGASLIRPQAVYSEQMVFARCLLQADHPASCFLNVLPPALFPFCKSQGSRFPPCYRRRKESSERLSDSAMVTEQPARTWRFPGKKPPESFKLLKTMVDTL